MIIWSNQKFVFYNPFYDELFVISTRMAPTADKLGLVYIGLFTDEDE